ncbi:MAG: tRNA 2-thiouridine(34) synthase MnmA [Deltaproteobacteria bacterium]|nr:tRNA 2-thiouridine(34) synthase MnmA [Deltaproteobacteria bacterium]MBW2383202.1 tRNA 2-thiouridine(34) synthase MnmA [Deltaproteobacteria bacterium]MBW2697421.1 tRNA 2-thiouridine(34) synthase MnmA [Deltaproteobacteria bacterium]
MSGGVDSSLTAALLVESGAEVVGITMHLAGDASRCCSLEDADDARRVAEQLGVRFFVANYTQRFEEEVIQPFADSYLAGRTPIPCAACNKRFKFDYLIERARILGAAKVATGHYARVRQDPESGRYELRRPADRAKDQTYFLFQLDQSQLARSAFPLGELTKEEVRERARALGLATADKPESQEICFVPDGDYAKLVEAVRPEAGTLDGEIVDEVGRVLGRHRGIHRFTVGQRHGLGISADRRLYVTQLEPETRRVVVGGVKALDAEGAIIDEVHWIAGETPGHPVRGRVQIRHRHEGASACIEPLAGGGARVIFDRPVRAVAPGQAAVFYAGPADDADGERVLGGGWIREAVR